MIKLLRILKDVKTYDYLYQNVIKQYQIICSELDILLFLYNNSVLDSANNIVEQQGMIKICHIIFYNVF